MSTDYRMPAILDGIILLVGPPASGKSTFAQKLLVHYGLDQGAYISNDAIAKDMFDVTVDRGDKDGEIFAEQDRRIAERLANGRVAIVDATNVKPEARQRLIAIAQQYGQPVTAFCFRRDVETLLRQNQMREVKVPEAMVREYEQRMEQVTLRKLRSEGISAVIEV
ncbi:MAG TPA: ATP-binding protein [Candidatus Saccharimonadales bacterium]|nr:ATP-binding protein [Candidatus Saccharimonadales bacterium]